MRFIRCYKLGYLDLFHHEYGIARTIHYEPELQYDSELVKSFGRELFKGGIELTDSNMVLNLLQSNNVDEAKILYNPEIKLPNTDLSFKADVVALSYRLNWILSFYSSSRIELPNHIYEAGFRLRILKSLNLDKKIELKVAYLDRNYEREQQIDIDKLFIIEDVSIRAKQNMVLIDRELIKIQSLINDKQIPYVKRGVHCISPNKCDFYNYCWSKVYKKTIYEVYGLTQKQIKYLEDHNIETLEQIPDDFKMSNVTLNELRATLKNKPIIKRAKINKWFEKIDSTGPLTFLSILTFKSPVPAVENSKPFETFPYAYCLAYRNNPFSDFVNKRFIADKLIDPRIQFIINLIHDIKSTGPIIVYEYKLIVSILEKSIKYVPEYKETILSIIKRCWDLGAIVNKRWYYHHSMEKSHDLKTVLKSLDVTYRMESKVIKTAKVAASYYRLLSGYPLRKEWLITRQIKDYTISETDALYQTFEIFNSM